MSYPKRSEKRKQTKKKVEAKTLLISILFLLINLPLILSQNFFLLSFSLPITIFSGILLARKKQLHVYGVIFFLLYISYLELSFRIWAQN